MSAEDRNLFSLDEYTPKVIDSSLKGGFKTIMSNIGTLIAIMCIMLMVSVFLFNVSIEDIFIKNAETARHFIVDAAITVVLYICMQNAMITNGTKNGLLDPEFVAARTATVAKREEAKKKGCPRMVEFCDAYVAAERRDTRRRRLTRIPLSYEDWETNFGHLTDHEIKALPRRFKIFVGEDRRERELIITRKVRAVLRVVAKMRLQTFTPDMLLYDDTHHSWRRRLLMPAPEEKIKEQRRASYAPTIIAAVMTAFLVFKFAASPTWATAIYCLLKLFGLIQRGAKGYSIGFLAYSVHGVKYYQSQEVKFYQYERWLEKEENEYVFDF